MQAKAVPRLPTEVGRDVLRKSLPIAIRHALKNYRTMAFAEMSEDARAFQQHQTACKSALAHIEGLLKLAAMIEAPGKSGATASSETTQLLAEAEAAVAAYENPDINENERA